MGRGGSKPYCGSIWPFAVFIRSFNRPLGTSLGFLYFSLATSWTSSLLLQGCSKLAFQLLTCHRDSRAFQSSSDFVFWSCTYVRCFYILFVGRLSIGGARDKMELSTASRVGPAAFSAIPLMYPPFADMFKHSSFQSSVNRKKTVYRPSSGDVQYLPNSDQVEFGRHDHCSLSLNLF